MKGNFKTIVMLPKYVDTAEWVAVNSECIACNCASTRLTHAPVSPVVFDFYTNLNMFYGVISECCTTQSCPSMTGGRG